MKSKRLWGPLEIIQGFYLSQFLKILERGGAVDFLRVPQTAASLAKALRWNEQPLRAGLELLSKTTDILVKRRSSYQLRSKYFAYESLAFHVRKFLIAYGDPATKMNEVMRLDRSSEHLVSDSALAEAFARIPWHEPFSSPSLQVIAALEAKTLLDLGCGPGTLLLDLARHKPSFRGWGLDKSVSMCRLARQRLASINASSRVRIIRGDVTELCRAVPAGLRDQIQVVHAGSLLNRVPISDTRSQ